MNKPLLAATVLAASTALIHLIGGGADIASPLLQATLNSELKLTLYACWHGVSSALLLSAAFLGWQAFQPVRNRALLLLIGSLWFAFGLVFLAIALLHPAASIALLPQWSILLPVGVLALWSASKQKASV